MIKRLFILAMFITFHLQAQNKTIRGYVVDKEGKRLEFATVYLNNTSINTYSDANGRFVLNVPPQYKTVQLGASLVGFKHTTKNLDLTHAVTELVLVLEHSGELEEVLVFGKGERDWRKKWMIFKNGLLGETPFTAECMIKNQEVIKLEWDKKHKKVLAKATQPIEIQNDALGYKIFLKLDKFESDGTFTQYAGSKYFQPLTGKNEKIQEKYEKNRAAAFQNSFRNFLVVLAENKAAQNGFELFKIVSIRRQYFGKISVENEVISGNFKTTEAKEICFYDEESNLFYLKSELPLLVFNRNTELFPPVFNDFPYVFSQIELPNQVFTFTQNGWIVSPNGMILYDNWGFEGISNMLPSDYHLKSEMITIQPTEPLSDGHIAPKTRLILVQKNDSMTIAYQKDERFKVLPQNIPNADYTHYISEKDEMLSIWDILRKIPGLFVNYDAFNGTYKLYFRENGPSNYKADPNTDFTPNLLYNSVLYTNKETIVSILNGIPVNKIESIGTVRYGNNAQFGSKGNNGTIILKLNKTP